MSKTDTKRRITDTALKLFNEQGVTTVSTNHIALELNISPGNLYYHFKSKDALIDLLFSAYESELTSLFRHQFAPATTIEDAWFFLHLGFEIALRYRFIYQDTDYILQKCPSLSPRYRRILQGFFDSLLKLLNALSEQKVLRECSQSTLEELALNMLLICTQWMNFKQHLGDHGKFSSKNDLSQGIYQALSMVLPYLGADNQNHLKTLQQAYT